MQIAQFGQFKICQRMSKGHKTAPLCRRGLKYSSRNRRREKKMRTRAKLQAHLQSPMPSESPHRQPSRGALGAARSPEEKPGEGGEAAAAQCLSVAPQRGLETRHNACTVSWPSPAGFSSFSITSTTTFSGARATVCSSTTSLKETILRPTAAVSDCFCPFFFFHSNATTDILQENGRLSPCCC